MRILYLMGVDWHWIWQRPQILAEKLSGDHEVRVVWGKEVFQKQALQTDRPEPKRGAAFAWLPYRDKSRVIFHLQRRLVRRAMGDLKQYDLIWIGHPLLYRYIDKKYHGRIVYDCMDNHMALCPDERIRRQIQLTESELTQRADLIFASSLGLQQKLEKKGGAGKTVLIRNGFLNQGLHTPEKRESHKKEYHIGYFGTISEWFDFQKLMKSLEEFPQLSYHLFGPVSGTEIPDHPRLIHHGVVAHERLWDAIKEMDALAMPFVLNDLIRDVDPVKLYEYVSMGKPVISIYYEEIRQFSPFVSFYTTQTEYLEAVRSLMRQENCSYDAEQQQTFLKSSTWEERYRMIQKNLALFEKEK
ncbi:MAG: hypothetical protein Q4B01_02270 [Eubacteriales bacterium]|nr:hypothetical protein [Eubacteriales bacterium]